MREKNIFKTYFEIISILEKDKESELRAFDSIIYKEFYRELKRFFESGIWASSDEEILLFNYLQKGYKRNVIIERLRMNENTYHSKLYRLSIKINNMIFGTPETRQFLSQYSQVECPTALTLDLIYDDEAVKLTSTLLRNVLLEFDIRDELNKTIYIELEKKRVPAKDTNISEEELTKVIVFLASYANKTMYDRLDALDSKAIDVIMSFLEMGHLNLWQCRYLALKDYISEQKPINKKTLEYLDEKAKGYYA